MEVKTVINLDENEVTEICGRELTYDFGKPQFQEEMYGGMILYKLSESSSTKITENVKNKLFYEEVNLCFEPISKSYMYRSGVPCGCRVEINMN